LIKETDLTWRRFLILVRELPEESAYQRWIRNKDNRSFVEFNDSDIDREIKEMKVKK
jgi:hypothetical protein